MLAPWKKSFDQLRQLLKRRDITLLTKVHLLKATVFPVVMYGCASWTTKKTERWRIHAFELWCWRRFLRVPWTARRSSQPILQDWRQEEQGTTEDEMVGWHPRLIEREFEWAPGVGDGQRSLVRWCAWWVLRVTSWEKEMATHSSIPVDPGTWQAIVHGVAESQTRLSF